MSSVKSFASNSSGPSYTYTTTSTPVRTTIMRNSPNRVSTPPINRASSHVERMLNDILINRQTKQSCDITAKSVLFLKTRESAIHQSEYEITPSVQFNKLSVFEELKQRTHTCRLARDLIEFVAQERRHGFYYDEVFLQLRSEIIYTSNNFINAYYNCHCIPSIDPVDLAIQCVHLACKTQSTFKRLEKLVLAARNCFGIQINIDKLHFASIEMMILQSTGFQLQDVEDYPHKYIYKFKPKMASTYDVFKASDKKMMTLCHCAILLATKLVECCPIMLNRHSPAIAAACLYISNGFKDILNIKEWWKNIEGCKNLSEKKLQEDSDLIFDAVKHSECNWTTETTQITPIEYNVSNNIGNVSIGSIGQSPPQQMLSPMSSLASENRSIDGNSSGFGSENGRHAACNASRPKIEKQVLQSGHLSPLTQFIKQQSFTYKNSNSCSASTCSSESNSVKGELTSTKSELNKSLRTFRTTSDYSTSSNIAQHHPDHNFSKPEQIPFRKSTSIASPLTKTTNINHPQQKPVNLTLSPVLDIGSLIDNDGLSHKLERNYKNRLTAILCCEEITKFYASSKQRYAILSRNEKDIVKDYKNKVKSNRRQKLDLLNGQLSTPKKRRRHSVLPSIGFLEKRQRISKE